jgi:hypothetical protein
MLGAPACTAKRMPSTSRLWRVGGEGPEAAAQTTRTTQLKQTCLVQIPRPMFILPRRGGTGGSEPPGSPRLAGGGYLARSCAVSCSVSSNRRLQEKTTQLTACLVQIPRPMFILTRPGSLAGTWRVAAP